MTEDYTIQQQRPSALPYVLGGAAVGGATYFLPEKAHLYQTPRYASYEDILAESEDTFKSEIEKGGENKGIWESAQNHANALRNAEKEYEQKVAEIKAAHTSSPITQLPEGNAAKKALEDAQNAYNQALEAEKSKLSQPKTRIGNFLTPDEVLSHGFDSTQTQNSYTRLFNNYQNAVAQAERGSVHKQRLSNFEQELNTLFESYREHIKNHGNPPSDKDIRNSLVNIIERQILPDEITNFSDYKAKGYPSKKAYQRAYRDEMKQKRKALAEEILGEKIETTVQNRSGQERTINVFRNANGNRTSFNKLQEALTTIENDLQSKKVQRQTNGRIRLMNYTIDAQGNIRPSRIINTSADLLTVQEYETLLNRIKGGTSTNDQIRNSLNTLKDLAQRKERANLEFTQSTRTFFESISRVQELREAQAREIAQATRQESGQLRGFISKNTSLRNLMNTTTQTLSPEELATQAENALRNSSVATNLTRAEQAAQAELQRLGINSGELSAEELNKLLKEKGLGSLEEYKSKLKSNAEKDLASKIKNIKSGNRWVTAAVGAAVLALGGLALRPSAKEN